METYTYGSGKTRGYISVDTPTLPDEIVTGPTFQITKSAWYIESEYLVIPETRARYYTFRAGDIQIAIIDNSQGWDNYVGYFGNQNTNTVVYHDKASLAGSVSPAISTSSIFNYNNKTTRSVTLYLRVSGISARTPGSDDFAYTVYGSTAQSKQNLSTCNVILDAPPLFGTSQISFTIDTDRIYAGHNTASVTVDTVSGIYGARYDGYITKIRFEVGQNQYDELEFTENNQPTTAYTLSVPLTISGTHIASVSVTDSRNQTNTISIGKVVVNEYVTPSVLLSQGIRRTRSTGIYEDEGTYAVLNNSIHYTYDLQGNRLLEPIITITDADGVTTTPSVTWYSDRDSVTGELNSADIMTWDNVTAPYGTVFAYALLSGFNPNKSYDVSVTPRDMYGSGQTMTVTLEPAFFTVDFLAGGHGIAFGTLAKHEGFVCNMDSYFYPLVGTVQMYAGQTAPSGWLICDGTAISRTIYDRLFDVIGTTYGAGDGSTTFNLPDLQPYLTMNYIIHTGIPTYFDLQPAPPIEVHSDPVS